MSFIRGEKKHFCIRVMVQSVVLEQCIFKNAELEFDNIWKM